MAEAVVTPIWAPGAKYDVWTGVLPWTTTAWKVALLDVSFVIGPGVTLFAEVSADEVSGSGYVAGGSALTGLGYQTLTPNSFRLSATDSTISPSADLSAGWAVVYDTVSDRIAFFVQFAGEKTATSSTDFVLDWGNNLDSGGLAWVESTLNGSVGAYTDNSLTNWNAFTTYLGRVGTYKPQYPIGANSTSYSNLISGVRSILNPVTFPGNGGMVIVLTIPPKTSGQTFAAAATTTVNKAPFESVGVEIENAGTAAPRGDGRPSLIVILGQECNGSGYFQFQPQNDTDADYYALMVEQEIGWIRGQITPENRANVKFACSFISREGPSTQRLARMLAPSCELIDCHVYDDNYRYSGLSQAAKDAVEADVWTDKLSGTQGLTQCYALATANGLAFMVNEWGVQNTTAPNTGGGDHPDFVDNMVDWIETYPLADGVLSAFNYTWTNASGGGTIHNKLGTGEFPLASAQFLARLG